MGKHHILDHMAIKTKKGERRGEDRERIGEGEGEDREREWEKWERKRKRKREWERESKAISYLDFVWLFYKINPNHNIVRTQE